MENAGSVRGHRVALCWCYLSSTSGSTSGNWRKRWPRDPISQNGVSLCLLRQNMKTQTSWRKPDHGAGVGKPLRPHHRCNCCGPGSPPGLTDKHIPDPAHAETPHERNSFPEAVNPMSPAPDDAETAGACWAVRSI